ncbi:MAG: hypothetical protein AB7O46_14875, partial [Xanthobacteraceae bacterium]
YSIVNIAAHDDCPGQNGDCCDHTKKGRRLCVWNDACAASCHVNAGLEAAAYVPAVFDGVAAALLSREPLAVEAVRAGPLFRPPIF